MHFEIGFWFYLQGSKTKRHQVFCDDYRSLIRAVGLFDNIDCIAGWVEMREHQSFSLGP